MIRGIGQRVPCRQVLHISGVVQIRAFWLPCRQWSVLLCRWSGEGPQWVRFASLQLAPTAHATTVTRHPSVCLASSTSRHKGGNATPLLICLALDGGREGVGRDVETEGGTWEGTDGLRDRGMEGWRVGVPRQRTKDPPLPGSMFCPTNPHPKSTKGETSRAMKTKKRSYQGLNWEACNRCLMCRMTQLTPLSEFHKWNVTHGSDFNYLTPSTTPKFCIIFEAFVPMPPRPKTQKTADPQPGGGWSAVG